MFDVERQLSCLDVVLMIFKDSSSLCASIYKFCFAICFKGWNVLQTQRTNCTMQRYMHCYFFLERPYLSDGTLLPYQRLYFIKWVKHLDLSFICLNLTLH